MEIKPKEITLKNGAPILLRSARPEDAPNMLQHLRKSHLESYRNLNRSPKYWEEFSETEEKKILADFETSPSKFMLVALSQEKIVGGLALVGQTAEFSRKTAGLGMSIQKAFSGSGLGTEMLRCMLATAKAMGFRRLELSVRTYNQAGIALYEKVGFQRIGLLKDAALIDGAFVDEFAYQILI